MAHILKINEWFVEKPLHKKTLFDEMPSVSDEQRPKKVGIEKCWDIFNSRQAQNILKKYNVTAWKTRDCIALYFPVNVKSDVKGKIYSELEEYEMIMQECVNELDRETELYFETYTYHRWDFGKMNDKIVYRYVSSDSIDYLWRNKTKYGFDRYYDMGLTFNSLTKKGYNYLIEYVSDMHDMKIKDYSKSSDIDIDEIKEEMFEYAKDYVKRKHPGYSIELVRGKRGFDTERDEYESFIVYRGSSSKYTNQIGGFEFLQNKFGDVKCLFHHVLGGSTSFGFDINNWKGEIESVIDMMVGRK